MTNRKFNNKIMAIKIDDLGPYDGEIFKRIDSFMVNGVFDYYLISNYGRIYNSYLNIFLKPGISGSGYYFVYLSTIYGQKIMQLHRLVMIAFNPVNNYEMLQVNHIDGNKLNDNINNLEWVTRSENVKHAYETGLNHIGEDNVNSKITEETALKICELLSSDKYTIKQIADICNTTISIVSEIKKHNTWTHISKDYTFNQRVGKLFSDDMIINICIYFENNNIGNLCVNDHCRNALKYYNYDTSDNMVDSARKIYTRKYYTHISKNYNF